MPMPETTPERKPCGTCGEPRSINADGTVRHHFTENPEWQAGPDSRKCKGAGELPAGAVVPDQETACRLCGHPAVLTDNGRVRSHLTPEQTPRPCPGGSDFPRGAYPDMIGTTDGLVATIRAECDHVPVGQCYDCYGAPVPAMADQFKTGGYEPLVDGRTADGTPVSDEPAPDDDGRPEADRFTELLAQETRGAGTVPDRVKADPTRLSELTRDVIQVLEQRTPEQKAETAARMDRTASAALGLPVDSALNHPYTDPSGVAWVHEGPEETCAAPECETRRRIYPDGVYCSDCDTDNHRCPGCGTDVSHGTVACAKCTQETCTHLGGFTENDVLDDDGEGLVFTCGVCGAVDPGELSAEMSDAWRTPDDLLAKMPEEIRDLDALRLSCVECTHRVTPLVDRFGTDGRAAAVTWHCELNIMTGYRECRGHECVPDRSARLGDLDEGDLFVRRGTLMRLTERESASSVLAEVMDGPHKGRTGELKNLNETVERAACHHVYTPGTDAVTGEISFTCDHCGKEQETKECTDSKAAPTGTAAGSPRSAVVTTDQSAAAAAFLGGGTKGTEPVNQADAAAQFLAGGSGAHGEAETKRDRFGRYLILHPDTGHEKAWTRATTFAKSISDTYALSQWGLRMALLGATMRPDIVSRAHGKHAKADKRLLDDLTAELKSVAGDKVAANHGTNIHSFTELADRAWKSPGGPRSVMGQVPPDYREMVETYIRLLEETGLEPVANLIEFTTVVKQYGVAGTSDNCYKVTKPLTVTTSRGPANFVPGEYVIGDKKTGADLSYGWQEIAIQLAVYAQGINTAGVWDRREETWDPDPLSRFDRPGLKVRDDAGIVVHLPLKRDGEQPTGDEKQPTVYGLDLESGWNAAVLCERVRAWRKVRKLASPVMVAAPDTFSPVRVVPEVTTRTTVRPPSLRDKAESVTSKGEASAVWQEAKKAGLPASEVDGLVSLMQSRLQKLTEPAG